MFFQIQWIKATTDIMGYTEVELTLNTYTDASEDFKRQEIALLDALDFKQAMWLQSLNQKSNQFIWFIYRFMESLDDFAF